MTGVASSPLLQKEYWITKRIAPGFCQAKLLLHNCSFLGKYYRGGIGNWAIDIFKSY